MRRPIVVRDSSATERENREALTDFQRYLGSAPSIRLENDDLEGGDHGVGRTCGPTIFGRAPPRLFRSYRYY